MLLQLPAQDASAAAGCHEAEACFQRAIAVAHGQGAKSLELQASISLARLWQRQGRGNAAHEALARIHASFSEGTDTADWLEAQALLAELAGHEARDLGPARA
jgi:predicted ATPase